jgi:hypothetical protein
MPCSLVQATTRLTPDRRSSSERFVLCVLLLLGSIIWLPRLNGPLDLRWDAGTHYVLGTSLAEGRGYRLLNEPGNIESIQYPPLLPILIALHQLALGTSDPLRVGQALRFIVLVNPTTIVMSDFCLSDVPFALIAAVFFLLQQHQNRRIVRVLIPLTAVAAYQYAYGGNCLAGGLGNGRPAQVHKDACGVSAGSIVDTNARMAIVRSLRRSGPQFKRPAYEYQRADSMYYNTSYARNVSLVDPFQCRTGYISAPA